MSCGRPASGSPAARSSSRWPASVATRRNPSREGGPAGSAGGVVADGGGADDAEARFLEEYDPGAYQRLSVAVDVALVSATDGHLRTLVVRRREHPGKGRWALPGGFVRPEESLEE